MRILAGLIFSIWIGGAVIMTIFFTLSERVSCINNEGFVKGLLWCESQPRTRMEFSEHHTSNMLKGALWPLHLAQYITDNEASNNNETYLCREVLEDIQAAQAGNEAAKQRAFSRFQEVMRVADNNWFRRLNNLASVYYGHKPSSQELTQFSGESLRLGIGICANDSSLTLEQAVLRGAEHLSINK